jgi:hypothetical protein
MRAPAEPGQLGNVEELARGSIRFRGVEDKATFEADNISDEPCERAIVTSVPLPMLIGSSSDQVFMRESRRISAEPTMPR